MAEPVSDATWPVEVRPAGLRFDVTGDETVFAAAGRAGLRWPTVCGGNGTCGTCVSAVTDGAEHCSPIGALERETLTDVLRQPADGGRRLVCQLRVTGPLVVTRRGVRPSAPPAGPGTPSQDQVAPGRPDQPQRES
jgi:2Fe-2S ferredoxin